MLNLNGPRWYKVPSCSEINAKNLHSDTILFHGVNKSGSWAMADVLKKTYYHIGADENYSCRYFGLPHDREESLLRFSKNSKNSIAPRILIDHDLAELRGRFPSAKFITLLRDPIKRIISCYYWLNSHHPEFIKNRDILSWAKQSGRDYTLCSQFAYKNGLKVFTDQSISNRELANIARTWFTNNISAFGLSEFFEESVFWIASHLGLDQVPEWDPDLRNVKRPTWDSIDINIYNELEEMFAYDVFFYQEFRGVFLKETFDLRNNILMKTYEASCNHARNLQLSYGHSPTKSCASKIAGRIEEVHNRFNSHNLNQLIAQEQGLEIVEDGLPSWWHDGNNIMLSSPSLKGFAPPKLDFPKGQTSPTNSIFILLSGMLPPITVWGADSTIYIGRNASLPGGRIVCGSGSLVYIGDDVRATHSPIFDARNNGAICIKNDCLISSNCRFITDDMHSILDVHTNKRINKYGGFIFIDSHVWIGFDSIIYRGAKIGKNCVIGLRSFVNSDILPGTLAAGSPARTLRVGISWDKSDAP